MSTGSQQRATASPDERVDKKVIWRERVRLQLRATRHQLIESDQWPPELSIFCPLPEPNWLVDDAHRDEARDGLFDAHTPNERKIYRLLKQIGERRLGRWSRCKGREVGEFQWQVQASHSELARLSGLHRDAVSRAIRGLARKHSIRIFRVRTRGEGGQQNREMSVYHLPHYRDVLSSRKEDPNIGADADGRTWTWGRRNSRRFLAPAEREVWRIPSLPDEADLPQLHDAEAKPMPALPPPPPAAPAELTAVERQVMQYVDLDDRASSIEVLARAVAAEWDTEISDYEICTIVDAIARSAKQVRTAFNSREPEVKFDIANAGFFVKQIQGRTRQYLRQRMSEEKTAARRRVAIEKQEAQDRAATRDMVRQLLLTGDPFDNISFHEITYPGIADEVRAELAAVASGKEGGGSS